MFDFKHKITVVTGGAQGIGKCIRERFEKAGATVCVIDLADNDYFAGDLADKETLETFAKKVISEYGHIDYEIVWETLEDGVPVLKEFCKKEFESNLYINLDKEKNVVEIFERTIDPDEIIRQIELIKKLLLANKDFILSA